MADELRKSGIGIIGDVPWGTHFCQFYHTKQDLLDILVPYFRAGLENNEFCMWVCAEPLTAAEARQAMAVAMVDFSSYVDRGQIEIIPYDQWYTKDGIFESKRVLAGWVDKLNKALANGFAGLRLTGNTFWLEKTNWQDFADYEAEVDSVIGNYRMLADCTYSLEKCGGAEIVDVLRNHEFALIKEEGVWEQIESSQVRKKKQALEESKEELAAILANVPILTLVVDPERRVLKANAAAAQFAGRPVGEMLGLPGGEALRCLHALDDPRGCGSGPSCQTCRARLSMLDTLATGQNHLNVEWQLEHTRDGKPDKGTFLLSTVHLNTPRKQVLVCIEDITERKRAEEAIRLLNENLRRRAIELEAANKELEAFSYSVSHDLRAPLRSMSGFSHALLEDYSELLDDRGKDYLRRVDASGQRMAQLIDDLLELSRVTRSEMQAESVNLSELARSVVEDLRRHDPGRRCEVAIAPDIRCRGDARLLLLVMENLLGNAWKFTGKREKASIEFGSTNGDDKTTCFVRDNGAGFDMAHADRLFKPFQRLHSESEFPGNGIGLASVQRVMNRLGGRVWAEGEVDKGATFYFTLER